MAFAKAGRRDNALRKSLAGLQPDRSKGHSTSRAGDARRVVLARLAAKMGQRSKKVTSTVPAAPIFAAVPPRSAPAPWQSLGPSRVRRGTGSDACPAPLSRRTACLDGS